MVWTAAVGHWLDAIAVWLISSHARAYLSPPVRFLPPSSHVVDAIVGRLRATPLQALARYYSTVSLAPSALLPY